MAQGDGAWTNVTVAFAIQQGGQWYAATANPLLTASYTPAIALLTPGGTAANYTSFSQIYTNTAALWQTLTFTNSAGVLLGGTPAHNTWAGRSRRRPVVRVFWRRRECQLQFV